MIINLKDINGDDIFVVSEQIVGFYEGLSGHTVIQMTNEDFTVSETPQQLCQLLARYGHHTITVEDPGP